MRQTNQIFDMGATFTLELINTIKKDKSFEMKLWIKDQMNLLIAPIKRHVKAARMRMSQREKALKTINRY